jgi:hypothetical protein
LVEIGRSYNVRHSTISRLKAEIEGPRSMNGLNLQSLYEAFGLGIVVGIAASAHRAYDTALLSARNHIGQPPTWLASVDAAYLAEYPDRESGMARVQNRSSNDGIGAPSLGAIPEGNGRRREYRRSAEPRSHRVAKDRNYADLCRSLQI